MSTAAEDLSSPLPAVLVGSDEHKELFCRVFIETHDPYDPARVAWPDLDELTVKRLRAMPFWNEAVSTEHDVARKVQALVPHEPDPRLREAIALNGFEEGRHSALLDHMLRHYEIPRPATREEHLSDDPLWDFMRVGYGECFDSFFSFGLYKLAGDSGLFPRPLLDAVAPIVQEEARHILFFANWVAYCRARERAAGKIRHMARCALAMTAQVWGRAKTAIAAARGGSGDAGEENDFMMGVKDSLDVVSSPRQLIAVCLRENDRRLAPYDPRLLRPTFVPTLARTLARVVP
ncbi:MAG: ferritin-like domain-containing protein [Candidatus Binatia bacterium]